MNKRINFIIGSGVFGVYLPTELLKNYIQSIIIKKINIILNFKTFDNKLIKEIFRNL